MQIENINEEINMNVIRYDVNNPILQVTLMTEYKQSRFKVIEMIRQFLCINIPKGKPRIYNGEPVGGHVKFTTYQAFDFTAEETIEKHEQKVSNQLLN